MKWRSHYSEESAKQLSQERFNVIRTTPFIRFPTVILCAASAYMLYNAPDKQPHVYYQILRWLTCSTAVMLAYYSHQRQNRWVPWLFGVMAILFNPLSPFHFARESWAPIDVVAAVIMLVAAFAMKPPQESQAADSVDHGKLAGVQVQLP